MTDKPSSIYQLQNIAQELVSNSEDISNVSIAVKNISNILGECVSQQVRSTSEARDCAGELSKILDAQVKLANENMSEFSEIMDRVSQSFKQTASIEVVIKEIAKSTAIVNKVANKTEVLAMNAGIQAAQAGKYGRGFHVLSKEIKKLANLCQDAANTISDSVAKSLKDVQKIGRENAKIQDQSNLKTSQILEIIHRILDIYQSEDSQQVSVRKIIALISSIEDESKEIDHICASVNSISEKLATQTENTNKIVSDVIGTINGVKITDVSPMEALAKINSVKIIDVRRRDEYDGELGYITSARLITIDEHFSEHIASLDRDEPYLFVCRSGGRSARAARIAQMNGFQKVFNLEGGMLAWNEANLPVIRSSKSNAA